MKTILLSFQIVLAVLMVIAVLLQSQGGGFGVTWSGGGETYHTRRGLEKVVFYFTIVASVILAINSLALLIL